MTKDGSWIGPNTPVMIVNWPGIALRPGDIAIALEAPGPRGQFRVIHKGQTYHVSVTEVDRPPQT